MAHIPIVGAVEPVLQEMLAQLKQLNVSKPNPEAIAACGLKSMNGAKFMV